MEQKNTLIRQNIMIEEIQLEKLKQMKKKTKYSISQLVRKGIDKILTENE